MIFAIFKASGKMSKEKIFSNNIEKGDSLEVMQRKYKAI